MQRTFKTFKDRAAAWRWAFFVKTLGFAYKVYSPFLLEDNRPEVIGSDMVYIVEVL